MKISGKRKAGIVLCLFALFLLPSLASAEIMVGQVGSLYSIGDSFDLTITLNTQKYTSDFVTATLVCSTSEIELLKSAYTVEPGAPREVKISTNLDQFIVNGAEGECYVRVRYAGEEVRSQKFRITKEVTVTLNIEGVVFDPNSVVNIHGQAKKANGEPLQGFIEVSIPDIDFEFIRPTNDGEFNLNFTIPSTMPSGSYKITAKAYEKDFSDAITNEGITEATVTVRQVVQKVEIAIGASTISPVNDLTYSVVLYDQAKEQASDDVSVTILKSDGTVLEKKIVRSGETQTIDLESSSSPGYWKIETQYNDLASSKEFFVEEYKDLSFTLENQTVTVLNTGNVPYIGPVEISIGSVHEIKDINLDLGESKRYKLAAPNGEYAIEVGEGTNKQTLGSTFLTGKAISVNAVGEGSFSNSLVVLVGLIVLLVVALVIVFVYKRIARRTQGTSGKIPKQSMAESSTKKSEALLDNSNLIDKGEKQESAIISLKIKNSEALQSSPEALSAIDSALWKAKEEGAKIYSDGDYRIMIFAPIITKERDNMLKSVRVAQSIERVLQSYNKRVALKVDFGIGIDFGNLIVEARDGKFRFMSVDNIIATTKRISEQASSETLISETLRRKTVGKLKTEKVHDKNFWRLEKVTDRSAHADYVRKMSERSK